MPVRGEGGEVVFPRSLYVECSSDVFNYIRSIRWKLFTQNDYLCFLVLENGPFSTSNRSTVTPTRFSSQPLKETSAERRSRKYGQKKGSGLLFQPENTSLAQRTAFKGSPSGLESVGNKCETHQRYRPTLQSLGKSANHKVAVNTNCLQRHVSLTGIKGGSSWRLSDQFAQSVT